MFYGAFGCGRCGFGFCEMGLLPKCVISANRGFGLPEGSGRNGLGNLGKITHVRMFVWNDKVGSNKNDMCGGGGFMD